jgi:4-oxalocrotonate tautomerase
MPVIQVDMLAGRDSATKAKLIKELTETYCRITGNPPQSVTIIMRDITHDSWGRAGEPMPPPKG